MFVGLPPGNYDRLLDFSRPVTGSLFFVPSATFLGNIVPDAITPAAQQSIANAASPASDTSLRIGSLKGENDE
jgi:putative iron-dependent peroxidase